VKYLLEELESNDCTVFAEEPNEALFTRTSVQRKTIRSYREQSTTLRWTSDNIVKM